MISVPAGARVLLATRPIDFRKGAHSLAALAQEVLTEDPFSGAVIVYRAKRSDRLKILVWDSSGLVLVWVERGERLGLATLEPDMDLGNSIPRQFHEGYILDDAGEQPFALAVRHAWITPERLETRRHGDESLMDCIVEGGQIFLPSTLSLLLCFCEYAEFVVPFRFKRVSDKAIGRINQHEFGAARDLLLPEHALLHDTVTDPSPHNGLRSLFGLRALIQPPPASSCRQSAHRLLRRWARPQSTGSSVHHEHRARGHKCTMFRASRGGRHIGHGNVCHIDRI